MATTVCTSCGTAPGFAGPVCLDCLCSGDEMHPQGRGSDGDEPVRRNAPFLMTMLPGGMRPTLAEH